MLTKEYWRILMCKLLALILTICFVQPALSAPGDPTIRILTVWTQEALVAISSNSATETALQISKLNIAFSNSGVRLNAVSAGVLIIPQKTLGVPYHYGLLTNIDVLRSRDATRADVVIAIVNAVRFGGATIDTPNGIRTASSSFAALDVFYLELNVYQHEFGHLLGARHQDSGGIEQNDSSGGVFHGAYVRGKPFFGTDGKSYSGIFIHTIMAREPIAGLGGVSCISQQVLYYSAPSVAVGYVIPINYLGVYYPAFKIGDATHNNTLALNTIGQMVSQFRNIKLAPAREGSIFQPILHLLLTE